MTNKYINNNTWRDNVRIWYIIQCEGKYGEVLQEAMGPASQRIPNDSKVQGLEFNIPAPRVARATLGPTNHTHDNHYTTA